jgi:chromosome segregation ATPase
MRRASPFILIFTMLLTPTMSFAQTTPPSTDSQTLQALLREVRELRQEMRTITVATERAQILLSREQMQQSAVENVQKEVDAAKASTGQSDRRVRQLTMQIKYYTDEDNEDTTPNAEQRQRIEQELAAMKTSLGDANNEDAKDQSAEMQAGEKLQIEQSKLAAIQAELDQLDRNLQNLASQPVD